MPIVEIINNPYLTPFFKPNPKGKDIKSHSRANTTFISPPWLSVKLENIYPNTVYPKYTNPNVINNIPKEVFFLKPLPFKYLIPTYIPIPEIVRVNIERKKNGKSISKLTPEAIPKAGRMIKAMMVVRSINTDGIKISIPKLLDFNCFLNISILKDICITI